MFCEIVTLTFPDFLKPFIFTTDASDVGISGVLSQLNKSNVEHPVAHYSRSLLKAERKYAVTRKEMLTLLDHSDITVVTYSAKNLLYALTIQLFHGCGHLRSLLVRSPAESSKWLSTTLILYTDWGSNTPTLTLCPDTL